jgi:hypothetical protein
MYSEGTLFMGRTLFFFLQTPFKTFSLQLAVSEYWNLCFQEEKKFWKKFTTQFTCTYNVYFFMKYKLETKNK